MLAATDEVEFCNRASGLPRGRVFRLACVMSSLRGGGAELAMARLTSALAHRGHKVCLVTLSGTDSDVYPLSSNVKRYALGREDISSSVLERLRNTKRRIEGLRSAFADFAPECVVSFIDVNNVIALLSNLKSRLPIVVSERTDPRFHPLDLPTTALRFVLYATADAIVMQTESTRAWAEALPRNPPVFTIPNAVDDFVSVAPTSETDTFSPYVLAAGRLVPVKGFDSLIRAFAIVRRRSQQPIRLVILGEGPERSRLESLATELGIAEAVSMPGWRAMGPWLSHARAFVLSSRYEGFPNALAEAMSAGLPVVATRCKSGPEEMIAHGESGLLVAVDEPGTLADAIGAVLWDSDLRAQLGSRARQSAKERFASEAIWSAWERVILAAISHRAQKRTQPRRA